MCHLLLFLFDINLSLFCSFKLGARFCSCLCPCRSKITPWVLMVQFQVLSRVTENRSWPLSIQIYPWCNFIEGEGAAMRVLASLPHDTECFLQAANGVLSCQTWWVQQVTYLSESSGAKLGQWRHDSPHQPQRGLCCLREARKTCANASIQTCNWNWQRRGEFPAPLSHQISSVITPDRESLFLGSCGFNFGLCPAQAAQISKGVDFLYNRGGMHRSVRRRRDTRCLWMS